MRLNKKFNYVALLFFFLFSIILLKSHEPWADEAQAWLIARDVPDFSSLINQMGYEGSPALWHTILLPFAKSGLPYSSMAVIHFLFMLTAVFIFIKNAPFTKFQKFLFIFGYYIFYEYNIIARSYVLTVLLLFIIASIYKNRFNKPVVYSILLFLLANTNIHSLVIVIVLSGLYFFEAIFRRNYISLNKQVISLVIIALCIFISMYQVLPPGDLTKYTSGWNLDLTFFKSNQIIGRALTQAFVPIPEPARIAYLARYQIIIGLYFFLLSLVFFVGKKKPFLLYLISSVGLLSLFLFKHVGYLRHHGLVFIYFIFSYWISENYVEKVSEKSRMLRTLINRRNLALLFGILLLCQIIGSTIAFYFDYKYDFSAGKRTAAFLKESEYIGDGTFIAAYKFWSISILPYIPKPYSRFYYVKTEEFGSYIIWNRKFYSGKTLFINEIVDRIDKATYNKNYKTKLIILNKELIGKVGIFNRLNLVTSFEKSIKPGATFYIYELIEVNSQ